MRVPGKDTTRGIASSLLRALRSVKLAVVALCVLALVSAAGAVIVQDAPRETYLKLYGPLAWRVLSATGLTNVFSSWWFLALVAWLVAGMLACSVLPLPGIVRAARDRRILTEESQYRQAQWYRGTSCRVGADLSAEGPADRAVAALRHDRYRIVNRAAEGGAVWLSARKGALGMFGPFLVHLSLIVVVAGGAWTALGRFQREIHVEIGQSAPIPGTPFSVRLHNFTVERYEDSGLPREYVSDVSLVENNRTIGRGEVRVNSPLALGEFRFYQWKYFPVVSDVTITVTRKADRRLVGHFKLPMGREIPVPQAGLTLRVTGFLPDFALTSDKVAVSRSPRYANPAARLEVRSNGRLVASSWVFPDGSAFHGPKQADYEYRMKDYTPTAASGLRVVRDRAVPLVFLGLVTLTVGTFLNCYVSPRWIWVMIRPGDGELVVHLAGRCGRELPGFRAEMDRCLTRTVPPGREAI